MEESWNFIIQEPCEVNTFMTSVITNFDTKFVFSENHYTSYIFFSFLHEAVEISLKCLVFISLPRVLSHNYFNTKMMHFWQISKRLIPAHHRSVHRYTTEILELAPFLSRHWAQIGGPKGFPVIRIATVRESSGVYVICIYCSLSVKIKYT